MYCFQAQLTKAKESAASLELEYIRSQGYRQSTVARHFSAAFWLPSGTLSISYLIYPPSGKGHILSQQEMFLSLYVFPSPITPILSSSHALNCDHRKPWKHKQTDGNSRRERGEQLRADQSLGAGLQCAQQTAPSAGKHSCPRFCCLSSSDCAFDHPKMSSPEYSFCMQPSIPENQNPA